MKENAVETLQQRLDKTKNKNILSTGMALICFFNRVVNLSAMKKNH